MLEELKRRSGNKCEVCTSENELSSFVVFPKTGNTIDECILTCSKCKSELEKKEAYDTNHWRCLNDAMWSEVEGVKVVAYRMLHALKSEGWPLDLLEMMYLEDATLTWAKEGLQPEERKEEVKHVDSNGVELQAGDSVVLIKDLKVKGGNFTAKRGITVRNIRLVQDNPEHIEGKVDGQMIVIITKYVKK